MRLYGRFLTSGTVRVLDTNVLVRLITRDNDAQVEIAEALLLEGPFLLLPSVLIEMVWVASSRYAMPRGKIATELRKLLGMANAVIVSSSAVAWALTRFADGADFADMLHFALAEELEATSFATFDKRIKPHQVEGSSLRLERLA